jgi:hypothetical protein
MRRSRFHIPGIAALRTGRIVVALEQGSWRIEDDQRRNIFVDATRDGALSPNIQL